MTSARFAGVPALRTLLSVIVAGVIPRVALAQEVPTIPYHTHFWEDGLGFGAMMAIGPLFMILFVAAIVAAVVLIVRWLGQPSETTRSPERTPLSILEERFARGEIDEADFEFRKRMLSQ